MANRNAGLTTATTGTTPKALTPKHPSGAAMHVPHSRYEKAHEQERLEARRAQIAELWTRGYTPQDIATTLDIGPNAHAGRMCVQREIAVIRQRNMVARMATLGDRITDAVMARQKVMSEAWLCLAKLAPEKAKDQAALFNVILDARRDIEKLEGTEAPERVNAAAIAEAFEHMMRAALALGGPELQQAFLVTLRGEMVESQSGQVLGISAPHHSSYAPEYAEEMEMMAADDDPTADDMDDSGGD